MDRDTPLIKLMSSLLPLKTLSDFRIKSAYVLTLITCAGILFPDMGRAALRPEPAPALGGIFLAPQSGLSVGRGRINLDCTDLGRSLDQGITRGSCRLSGK